MVLNNFHIALIGRTNVGKSTLFNRLSLSRDALVFDRAGVTRDIKQKEINILGKKAVLFDSPGIFDYKESDNKDPLISSEIGKKTLELLSFSDLILFVIDGEKGITEYDREIASLLRKSGKHVIVVTNKSEKKVSQTVQAEAFEFGFENVIPVSAEHGLGIGDLYEVIDSVIPESYRQDDDEYSPKEKDFIGIAIIGRPNVGKSTLLNSIIGENKQLTADLPGITREAADFEFEFNDQKVRIIDTPGVRKRARILDPLEKISASITRRSYRNADITILVIDAQSLRYGEIEKQDLTMAADVISMGKPLVIAFNKYDKTPYKKNDIPEFLKRNFQQSLSQLKDVSFIFTSALNKINIDKLLRIAISLYKKQSLRIKTQDLNLWLSEISKTEIMQSASTNFKMKYINQISNNPITFLIFVSKKYNIKPSHERFLLNSIKEFFNLNAIPVKIIFRDQNKVRK